MSWIIIPKGDGHITHENADPENISLPDTAEIYDDKNEFDERLDELIDNS